jgi:hypothetical protein
MVVYTYNPRTLGEAEAEGFRVRGQSGLQSKTLGREEGKNGEKEGREGGRKDPK